MLFSAINFISLSEKSPSGPINTPLTTKFSSDNTSLILDIPHYFGNLGSSLLLGGLINLILIYGFLLSNYFFTFFLSIFVLLGFGFKFTLSLIFDSIDVNYVFDNPFFFWF